MSMYVYKNFNDLKGDIGYHAFLDRFCRGEKNKKPIKGRKLNDWDNPDLGWKPDPKDGIYRNLTFYGGDLKGMISKLDYLQSLSIGILYLSPVNESEEYHGYDPTDQFEIDPWKGNWDDFKQLCKEGAKRGIKVIPDLVFNHTSILHPYVTNPSYRDWYRRDRNGNITKWFGMPNLMECNLMSKQYQQECARVIKKYLDAGARGVRLDLAECFPKDFLFALQSVRRVYPNMIMVGEMWDIATNKSDPKIFDGQLDSIMNYPMADAILRWVRQGRYEHFNYTFYRIYNENGGYPKEVQDVLFNNVATHDTPSTMYMLVGDLFNNDVFSKRIWNMEDAFEPGRPFNTYRFREHQFMLLKPTKEQIELGIKLLKLTLCIEYNIPGIPFLYQGTEIGLYAPKDPFNRMPMPWNLCVDSNEMLQFVRALGKYRIGNRDVLAAGKMDIVHNDSNVLILSRYEGEKKLYMAVNRTTSEQYLNFKRFGNNINQVFQINGSSLEKLGPYGIVIGRMN